MSLLPAVYFSGAQVTNSVFQFLFRFMATILSTRQANVTFHIFFKSHSTPVNLSRLSRSSQVCAGSVTVRPAPPSHLSLLSLSLVQTCAHREELRFTQSFLLLNKK